MYNNYTTAHHADKHNDVLINTMYISMESFNDTFSWEVPAGSVWKPEKPAISCNSVSFLEHMKQRQKGFWYEYLFKEFNSYRNSHLNQSLVAFIFHIGTVKPVLFRNITNQELIKDVNIIVCING